MDLEIRNVAKIEYANLKLDGITVIAGENNTGKSTIGKIVFSLFNSLHGIGAKVASDRYNKLANIFENEINLSLFEDDFFLIEIDMPFFKDICGELVHCDYMDRELLISRISDVFRNIYEYERMSSTEEVILKQADNVVDKIIEVLSITDEQIRNIKVSEYFNQVFLSQVNNIGRERTGDATVRATIKDKTIGLTFQDNVCVQVESNIKILNKAIYIDNPFVLDKVRMTRISENIMTRNLVAKLRRSMSDDGESNSYDDAIIQNRLKETNRLLASVVHGNFVKDNTSQKGFLEEGNEIPTKIQNVSTGLKSFLILKQLIENKQLKEKDVVVLDEPEIHLHPQWQLIYAKLIVELQRAFDLNIIITTHSPYFLAAIEKYAGSGKEVNYYLADVEHNVASFTQVNDCLYKVYELLSQPFEEVCDEED